MGLRGIRIDKAYLLNIILLADVLVLIAPTEDDHSKHIFYLDKVVSEYAGRISTQKQRQ